MQYTQFKFFLARINLDSMIDDYLFVDLCESENVYATVKLCQKFLLQKVCNWA